MSTLQRAIEIATEAHQGQFDKAGNEYIGHPLRVMEMGATEESVRAEAQEMAIDDIIFELVRRAENITLTEEEKESLFDKYVEKYVEDYGYSKSYVKKNMSELIYESMLYDKTTEFLIKNNDFQ